MEENKSDSNNLSAVNVSTPKVHDKNLSDSDINQKYCNSKKCKFMFVHSIREQESSGNIHFYSFIRLAEILNRTIVLVNVQNSRLGACKKFPFSFYYNTKELQQTFPKVRFITQDDFLQWTKERNEKPNVIFRSIQLSGILESTTLDLNDFLRNHCLDKFNFNTDNYPSKMITIGPNQSSNDDLTTENYLISQLNLEVEVLLIKHIRYRLPSFGKQIKPIPYASHLINAANKVSKQLSPYLAIHWRMETAKSEMMPSCAKGLVKYINKVKSKIGIENIYFATDYPLGGQKSKTQSDTFHKLYQGHHEAFRILNSTFMLNTWVVSKEALDFLYERFPNYGQYIDQEFNGSGIQGIFDKLILINSNYFISGPRGCARTSSKYTRKIREERKKLIDAGNNNLLNVFNHWSMNQ